MTKRENLRRALAGEEPRWVPFAPNFAQWYSHHHAFGTLPEALCDGADYVDAMKTLGCDIFSRNVDGGYRERDPGVSRREVDAPTSTGPRRTITITTPAGELRMVRRQQAALSTSYEEEHFVKDWSRDGTAFRYVLDQREYDWDAAAFDETDRRIGDDGLVNVAYLPASDRSRFIFSASCQTSIRTPWERLEQVREICRAWGGRPDAAPDAAIAGKTEGANRTLPDGR